MYTVSKISFRRPRELHNGASQMQRPSAFQAPLRPGQSIEGKNASGFGLCWMYLDTRRSARRQPILPMLESATNAYDSSRATGRGAMRPGAGTRSNQ